MVRALDGIGVPRGPKTRAGGEHERGEFPPPSLGGFWGISPDKIFKINKMSVETILMHFETIFVSEIRLIVQVFHLDVFLPPPLKNEQLFRPLDRSHQAVSYM